MIFPATIIDTLERNTAIFESLLRDCSIQEYNWQYADGKWCLLEIICHLYDEEREDFRARLRHVLETPDLPLPKIDPQGWVGERDYLGQDYDEKLAAFLQERLLSVQWLRELEAPNWDNAHLHPKFGPMSGRLFLSNWLAHDYLHIRQILTVKHHYLAAQTGINLAYAGNW